MTSKTIFIVIVIAPVVNPLLWIGLNTVTSERSHLECKAQYYVIILWMKTDYTTITQVLVMYSSLSQCSRMLTTGKCCYYKYALMTEFM